jgi:uncharacterized protein YcfL
MKKEIQAFVCGFLIAFGLTLIFISGINKVLAQAAQKWTVFKVGTSGLKFNAPVWINNNMSANIATLSGIEAKKGVKLLSYNSGAVGFFYSGKMIPSRRPGIFLDAQEPTSPLEARRITLSLVPQDLQGNSAYAKLTITNENRQLDLAPLYVKTPTEQSPVFQAATKDYINNAIENSFCNTVKTRIAETTTHRVSLLKNNRNICVDINGCSYRVWSYDRTHPAGKTLLSQNSIVFNQIDSGEWHDARGDQTGKNGDTTSTQFINWGNFNAYDDLNDENDPNELTIQDNSKSIGYVFTICDF